MLRGQDHQAASELAAEGLDVAGPREGQGCVCAGLECQAPEKEGDE